jgi:hypothetical protein
MKLGDRVGIVADHTHGEEAMALRAILETFRLQVDLYRLVQRWQAEEFFAKRAKGYDHLILACHGTDTDKGAGPRIKLEVIEPRKDNPELGDIVEFPLTPANVPDKLTAFKGVFVSMACFSGSEALGTAFLKAGCRAYLGPGDYSDGSSGMMYVLAIFHFLSYEWRLPDPHTYTIAQAAEAARKLDPTAKFGTKIWKLYEHK